MRLDETRQEENRPKNEAYFIKTKINKAVYTAALVACWLAGAVKSQKKHKKLIAN